MKKLLSLLFLILIALSSCKKESPQWDVHVILPVAKASIGVDKFIPAENLQADQSGLLSLIYDSTYSLFKIDSIYRIPDTTISTITRFVAFPGTILPGQSFPINNNNILLRVNTVQLKRSIIRNGFITLNIKNTLQSRMIFTYTIPKAKKNGVPFTVTAEVDSGSLTDPKFFTGTYDFADYDIEMTGSNNNQVNTIAYNISVMSDPNGVPFNIGPLDTIVNLKTSLSAIEPEYAEGYLGQSSINQSGNSFNLLGNTIQSGTLAIEDAKLNLDLFNYIGCEGQAYLSSVTGTNSWTGNGLQLVASGITNSLININRASKSAVSISAVNPSVRSFTINNTNSNLNTFLANLPNDLTYNIDLNINPLGNISGGNDFVFRDKLFDTRLKLEIPFRLGVNNLIFVDTVAFNIDSSAEHENLGNMDLMLVAENGFPFDIDMQLSVLDENGSFVDSLLVPGFIRKADVDVISNRVSNPNETRIAIPLPTERKDAILTGRKLKIRGKFNSANFPGTFPILSSYKLYLKLIADGIYLIR